MALSLLFKTTKAKLKRDADARAFLPAALEIIDTPPSPTGRFLSALICLFVILACVWSSLGQVDIVSIASGKIIPIGRSQLIQSPETGIVSKIYVQIGQYVKKGNILLTLDTSQILSEMERARGDLIRAQLDQLRLEAFLTNSKDDPFQVSEDFPPQLISNARQSLEADRSNYHAKLTTLEREVEQRQAELEAAKAELQRTIDILPYVEEKASIRKKSYETTYGSLLLSLEAEQQVVEVKSQQKILLQKISQTKAVIESIFAKRDELVSETIRIAFQDLNRALAQRDAAYEVISKAERRIELSSILATVDGVISQQSIFSSGAVVSNGQQLFTIVPDGEKFEIEAVLSNHEVGFVEVGNMAEIKVDAFPFTRYGLLKGHVTNISSDSEPQQPNSEAMQIGSSRRADSTLNLEASERLVYSVKISVEDQDSLKHNQPMRLIPGMSVRAEIKTGTRSIASYVLSPLTQALHESLKER